MEAAMIKKKGCLFLETDKERFFVRFFLYRKDRMLQLLTTKT